MDESAISAVDEDGAFEARVQSYSLEQLEDVFAHLDRESHPGRFKLVQTEVRSRLDRLSATRVDLVESDKPPSAPRRLWASVVDLFVSLLPAGVLGLILVGTGTISLGGSSGGSSGSSGASGRRGRGGRGRAQEEPALFDQALDFLTDSDKMLDALETYGPYYGGLVVCRILMVAPQWARSGSSAGLKETGVRIVDAMGHDPNLARSALRIVFAYLVYPATMGLGALWMVIDKNGRTLADWVSGVRVVRVRQPLESSNQDTSPLSS